MNSLLIIAVIAITSALVFYTFGVWAERKSKVLKRIHVVTFWLGLLFDATGTLLMEMLSKSDPAAISPAFSSIHGVTGIFAIVLMIFHAVWATFVLIKNDASKKQTFHQFSLIVWMIWLVPYFIGMFIGIGQ